MLLQTVHRVPVSLQLKLQLTKQVKFGLHLLGQLTHVADLEVSQCGLLVFKLPAGSFHLNRDELAGVFSHSLTHFEILLDEQGGDLSCNLPGQLRSLSDIGNLEGRHDRAAATATDQLDVNVLAHFGDQLFH